MGAAQDDRLYQLEKLRELKRERVRLIKRIKEIESIRGDGLKKGFDLLAEAYAVGLYDGNPVLDDNELLNNLRQITQWIPEKEEMKQSIAMSPTS